MVNLLESMHKCSLPSGVSSESPSAYEKSLVHKIFGGRLRSQVKCMQCSYSSNKFDPFLDLSLEIHKADSLRKALTHFTAREQLDGGERQYQCQHCKQKVKASKQLTVHKAPYVLSIHLKRFGAHVPGQKINKKVEFEPTLDMKPFVSGSYEGELKYTLYGVLVHAGWNTHSGHYYCFVRTSTGMWHSLDDNRVVQVSERTVLEQKAYMLFYVRDRKNLAPKKPTTIVRKEITLASVIVDRDHFGSNTSKKAAAQIGASRKETCSFSTVTSEDAVKVSSLNESRSKEASVQKTSDTDTARSSVQFKDNDLSVKDQVKEPSSSVQRCSSNQSLVDGLPQSAPSPSKASRDTLSAVIAPGANVDEGSHNASSVPVVASHDYTGSQISRQIVTGKAKLEVGVLEERLLTVSSSNTDDVSGTGKDLVVQSNKSSNYDYQNKGPKKEPTDQPSQKKQELVVVPEVDELVSAKIQNLQKVLKPKKKDHDSENLKKVLKPKKKLLKLQAPGFHLGSKLSLKTSVMMHKKKKHKKNKQNRLRIKNSTKVLLEQPQKTGLVSFGPEVVVEADSAQSVKQVNNSGSKKHSRGKSPDKVKISNGDSKVNTTTNSDFMERICSDAAGRSTVESPESISNTTCEATQLDTREPDSSEENERYVCQDDLRSVLTRDLSTVTDRWDGRESSSTQIPQILELANNQSITIGYVGDEWDEEYDRGKRRKVRGPTDSFDGRNRFQEISTMKAQSNKPRNTDRKNKRSSN